MARIRSIKPEFWSDEKLSECSLSARLTFIGLWTFADDQGRLEFQPVRLRMQIYPCGSVTLAKLREYIGELTERSLIRIYLVDGKEYLDIPGFTKHQRINRPTESKLPEHSLNTPGVLHERSPLEGKGVERKGDAPNGASTHVPEPPPGLELPVWDKWVDYRRGIKKPIKPVSVLAAMRELAAFGPEQGAVVEHTIANGWQGLVPPRSNGKPPARKSEWM